MRNRLREVLSEKGRTPYWLAKESGLSRTTVYGLVNDPERLPDGAVMRSICETLQIPVGDWVIWEPD